MNPTPSPSPAPPTASHELEPCPFCGRAGEMSYSRDGEVCNVRCVSWGHGCMGAGENCYTEARAISSWNRRAAPVVAPAEPMSEQPNDAQGPVMTQIPVRTLGKLHDRISALEREALALRATLEESERLASYWRCVRELFQAEDFKLDNMSNWRLPRNALPRAQTPEAAVRALLRASGDWDHPCRERGEPVQVPAGKACQFCAARSEDNDA